jgi:hypothetical protein
VVSGGDHDAAVAASGVVIGGSNNTTGVGFPGASVSMLGGSSHMLDAVDDDYSEVGNTIFQP